MNALSVRTELEKAPHADVRFSTIEEVLEFCQDNSVIPSQMFRYLEAEAGGELAEVPRPTEDAPVLTLDDIRKEFDRQCYFLGLPHTVTDRVSRLGNMYHNFVYSNPGLEGGTDLCAKIDLFLSDLVAETEKTKRLRKQQ